MRIHALGETNRCHRHCARHGAWSPASASSSLFTLFRVSSALFTCHVSIVFVLGRLDVGNGYLIVNVSDQGFILRRRGSKSLTKRHTKVRAACDEAPDEMGCWHSAMVAAKPKAASLPGAPIWGRSISYEVLVRLSPVCPVINSGIAASVFVGSATLSDFKIGR
ncbi:uncharacterized protein BDV17DRAFT_41947 [Aspergillus undulatus]|uniref:uncharacterized protein n=1 Tax=Aspergillus undulatus TaxID=1810928 RepID=UPI003CCD7B5A